MHERSMNAQLGHQIIFGDTLLLLLPERAVWWEAERCLIVSDLHLGKAERMARRGGALVPPYESLETISRLSDLIGRWAPAHVLCLGDSFDDNAAERALDPAVLEALTQLMAGRRWTWVLGNHDPGPVELGGSCTREVRIGEVDFRHIAKSAPATLEISGHYHPKASVRGARRPAFVLDAQRLIMPAFGTYTGGLDVSDPAIAGLMGSGAQAILSGKTMVPIPLAACTQPPAPSPVRWARGLG